MTAEIGAINLDFAVQRVAGSFSRKGFAQLVRQHEGRLVLAVEIAAKAASAERPFTALTKMQIAASRSTKAILREAKIVPDVTLKLRDCRPMHLNLRRVADGVGFRATAIRAHRLAVSPSAGLKVS